MLLIRACNALKSTKNQHKYSLRGTWGLSSHQMSIVPNSLSFQACRSLIEQSHGEEGPRYSSMSMNSQWPIIYIWMLGRKNIRMYNRKKNIKIHYCSKRWFCFKFNNEINANICKHTSRKLCTMCKLIC